MLRIALIVVVLAVVQESELLPPLKIGQTGYIQRTSEGRKVKVRKIVDDTTMTATVFFWSTPNNGLVGDSRVEVILKGIDTKAAVDDQFFDVPQLLVIGREKTKAGRTMFTLEPTKTK